MSFTSPRDVYLTAAARGVSILGDFLAATALVLALQERGAGAYAVAAVLIAAVLPPVVLAPLSGRVVDRVDSRIILTAVGLAQAICCAAMAYVSRPDVLIALAAVLAAGLAFTTPTFNALLPGMAGPAGVGRAMATVQSAASIGALAGPALAGVLVGLGGLRLPLQLDAVTYLAVVVAGLALRTRRVGRPAGATRGAGAWRMRDDPLLTMVTVELGALILTANITAVALVFFVRGPLHASAVAYGLVEATWTGFILVGAWWAAGRKWSDARLGRSMIVLHLLTSVLITGAGLVPNVGWLFPLWAVGGADNGVDNTFLGLLAARRVPSEVRGSYFAKFGAVTNGANLAGFVIAGWLVARFSPEAAIVTGGAVGFVAVAALAWPLWRAASRGPARAPEEAVVPATA
jgi:MFS family permease